MSEINKSKILASKTPPNATQFEESVLGAMMIDSACVDEVLSIVKSSDVFYKEENAVVFSAIADLHFKNEPVDLLTVPSRLQKMGSLEVAGGNYRIITLAQVVASSAHVEYHSMILVQQWMKRMFIASCSEVIGLCYDETKDVFEVENFLENKLDAIKDSRGFGKNGLTMAQATDLVVKRVEVLSNLKEGEITGVPTGFDKLNKETGGWQNTDLIIIAARPGMGKSAFCSASILSACKAGMSVGVISLEMSTQQLVTRLMSNNSSFHLNQLFRHGFENHKVNEYFPKLIKLRDEMKDYPVHFEDTPALDIRDIKAVARQWKRKHDISILIVDYLQLIKDATKTNREQEISSISQNLKAIAKELKIPVIALSQLSRAVETRGGDKKPQLSDLRESGAIEQDADLIGFLWRPEYYGFDVPEELESVGANCEFAIAKHRNGSIDRLGIWFDKNKTKFQDCSYEYMQQSNDVPY